MCEGERVNWGGVTVCEGGRRRGGLARARKGIRYKRTASVEAIRTRMPASGRDACVKRQNGEDIASKVRPGARWRGPPPPPTPHSAGRHSASAISSVLLLLGGSSRGARWRGVAANHPTGRPAARQPGLSRPGPASTGRWVKARGAFSVLSANSHSESSTHPSRPPPLACLGAESEAGTLRAVAVVTVSVSFRAVTHSL